ncbi:MAG TPA: hypothetical protein VJP85_06865 [Candidatus Baltobacteraceae bacterium]|nr:hypothetical protein [Candidatus Baltobacteraceae bacterium]
MRLAIACNGPGETAGWLRPFLNELYRQAPQADVHVFYVPDDYATGREPQVVRDLFPAAHVYDPKTYLKVALGAAVDGAPDGTDAVLYLGGDLMHAARLHKRFGGALATYKFSRERYARATAIAFAVDDANAAQLANWGVPRDRIVRTGNLAIDGALMEAQAPPEPGAPADGVLFMPGSRRYEVEQLIPFFFTAALALRREQPALPIAFGISPFTELAAVRAAVEAGGDPRVFAQRGTVIEDSSGAYLVSADSAVRFPILRRALSAARVAKLVVTIPGTKAIELAAIGKPAISCSPANAPELVTINGPLTYLDRVPVIGVPAKRAAVMAYSRRFPYHTQPNMDAHAMLIDELHGTLTPGRVARITLERLRDDAWLAHSAQALGALYREHVGAAARMAERMLALQQV